MVDQFGVPRVRCFCGNPLSEPVPEPAPTFTGESWQGFDPTKTTVIAPSEEPIEDLVIVDVQDEQPFTRPVGTDGAEDQPAPPDILLPTTTTTTTTLPPSSDITDQGTIIVSSEYPGGDYPASLAIDGDVTTSWFSAGPEANGTTSFEWLAFPPGQGINLDTITIIGNADHPEFPTGFGFDQVTVFLYDEAGNTIAPDPPLIAQLTGTPDPDVVIQVGGVRVSGFLLLFSGSEAQDCGGFAELIVTGSA
jgi:hypothetical protein